MLETRIIRELVVDDATCLAGRAHLSAASGLVKAGSRLFVVADDEHHLAMFDLSNGEPGRLVSMFAGPAPGPASKQSTGVPLSAAILFA